MKRTFWVLLALALVGAFIAWVEWNMNFWLIPSRGASLAFFGFLGSVFGAPFLAAAVATDLWGWWDGHKS